MEELQTVLFITVMCFKVKEATFSDGVDVFVNYDPLEANVL